MAAPPPALAAILTAVKDRLKARDTEAAQALLADGLKRFPAARVLHSLDTDLRVRALLAAEQYDAAAALLAHARAGDRIAAATDRQLQLVIARARGDWAAVRAIAQRQADEAGATADLLTTVAQACLKLDDPAGAAAAAAAALELDPNFAPAVVTASWAAFRRGDVEAALHYTAEIARLNPGDIRSALNYVRLLSTIGRVPDSLAAFHALRARVPDHPLVRIYGFRYFAEDFAMLRDLERVPAPGDPAGARAHAAIQAELAALRDGIACAPADAALRRGLVCNDPAQDVLIARCPGATTTVVLFAGFQDQMMGTPLVVFDRYMAALGVNAVYLKDYRRLLFLGGVASLGADYAATVVALRALVAGLGAARCCTIGASAGGLAAVRYGEELGAEVAISLAGPTNWSPDLPESGAEWWSRLVGGRFAERGMAELAELRPFLTSRPRRMWIEMLFGAEMAADVAQAAAIGDLERVRLHPLAGLRTHRVLDHLVQTTDVLRLLRELLRL